MATNSSFKLLSTHFRIVYLCLVYVVKLFPPNEALLFRLSEPKFNLLFIQPIEYNY